MHCKIKSICFIHQKCSELFGKNYVLLLCFVMFCCWKKLSSQRQFQKAVMVYKSLNGLAPDYMHSMFVNRDSVNPYSLRNTENKLAVPMPRTNYFKNSFSYSGAVLWNSLPIGLRQANNLINFRSGCAKLF